MTRPVFECQQCGQCCYGEGGIFIEPEDVAAIAEYLGISPEEFEKRFVGHRNGRLDIGTGANGACHFLKDNRCSIHPVKPKNCRLWPFLPGPLTEEWGFKSMKGNCPGFDPEASWDDFLAYYEATKNGGEQD